MNYSLLSRLQWICFDANILETMSRKMGEKEIVFVCVDMASVKSQSSKLYAKKKKTDPPESLGIFHSNQVGSCA